MQFTFGARESGSITCERAWPRRDSDGNRIGKTPHLYIDFRRGTWDSESPGAKQMYKDYIEAMREYKGVELTMEEVQEKAESYLLEHKDFGRIGRKSINRIDPTPVSKSPQVTRCVAFTIYPGQSSSQCEEAPEDGELFCKAHLPVKSAAAG